jgi:hypothetical protein
MSELLYVTAQPDVPYFHWQCEVYGSNFVEKGIDPSQIHMIFALVLGNKTPSKGAIDLKDKGYNVHFYIDDRDKSHYIPSIKPYMIHKWLLENPEFGKIFFLHDADIIFRELPKIDEFINDDDICYMSDTKGYIAFSYLKDCCDRYESVYSKSDKLQLIKEMSDVIGISVDCIKCNQDNSGGGQYIIKNTNSEDWYKIYNDSNNLYDQLLNYHNRFPISPGQIQFWTAEMWSLLWNLWYIGKETKIIDELNFSWATDSVDIYNQRPILHMAGVTEDLKKTKFYKGDFINISPLDMLKENINHFDYVDKNSSTIKYIELMKSIIKKN